MNSLVNNSKTLSSRLLLIASLIAATTTLAYCGQKDNSNAGPATVRTIVSHAAGDVLLERSGEQSPITTGQELQAQDFLITGDGSSVDLAVTGYGVVKIGAGTRVQVQSLTKSTGGSEARLRLERGNVASFINRQDKNDRFSIASPTAIAGVRGTSFMMSVDDSRKDPRVKVAVLSGAVAVQVPGQSEEVILEKNSQMTIDGFNRINRNMVRPLSEDSLNAIKTLAVFQKSNVLEFNSLLDDIRKTSPELQVLEGEASAETAMEDRAARDAREGGMDSVSRADRADVSKTLKRDTKGDPIQLKPSSSYTE
ncbi:MAG: FecR domain-containing protein [bacterium]|nr:FecR domain-containing protein [bacterium]